MMYFWWCPLSFTWPRWDLELSSVFLFDLSRRQTSPIYPASLCQYCLPPPSHGILSSQISIQICRTAEINDEESKTKVSFSAERGMEICICFNEHISDVLRGQSFVVLIQDKLITPQHTSLPRSYTPRCQSQREKRGESVQPSSLHGLTNIWPRRVTAWCCSLTNLWTQHLEQHPWMHLFTTWGIQLQKEPIVDNEACNPQEDGARGPAHPFIAPFNWRNNSYLLRAR